MKNFLNKNLSSEDEDDMEPYSHKKLWSESLFQIRSTESLTLTQMNISLQCFNTNENIIKKYSAILLYLIGNMMISQK